jgi:hypothetical protein
MPSVPKVVQSMSRWAYRATGLAPDVTSTDGTWTVAVGFPEGRARAWAKFTQQNGTWDISENAITIDGKDYRPVHTAHDLANALLDPDAHIARSAIVDEPELTEVPPAEAPPIIRTRYVAVVDNSGRNVGGYGPGLEVDAAVGRIGDDWALRLDLPGGTRALYRWEPVGSIWQPRTPPWRAYHKGADVTARCDTHMRAYLNSLCADSAPTHGAIGLPRGAVSRNQTQGWRQHLYKGR